MLADLRSGYDVRLIADLAGDRPMGGALPENRLCFYHAILAAVTLPDRSPYPEDELCRVAWEMWRKGERQLRRDRLPEDRLQPLLQERTKVLRVIGEGVYEFRHDQMRAYLAARWVQHRSPSTEAMLGWLGDEEIWRIGPEGSGGGLVVPRRCGR